MRMIFGQIRQTYTFITDNNANNKNITIEFQSTVNDYSIYTEIPYLKPSSFLYYHVKYIAWRILKCIMQKSTKVCKNKKTE